MKILSSWIFTPEIAKKRAKFGKKYDSMEKMREGFEKSLKIFWKIFKSL